MKEKEMIGGCCVCSDEQGYKDNPLVYCDGEGCNVAVHQACYGIVSVPKGDWFCSKCKSQERTVRLAASTSPNSKQKIPKISIVTKDVRCELCPSKEGALKRTDNNGWAHVVCALYIPEVSFEDVSTMEPIVLENVRSDRYGKVCFVCEEAGRGSLAKVGACMDCNKPGCKLTFHVTCGQLKGLLCELYEEEGSTNVTYCGYCPTHYKQMKRSNNMKPVPAYNPKHFGDGSRNSGSPMSVGEASSDQRDCGTPSSSSSASKHSNKEPNGNPSSSSVAESTNSSHSTSSSSSNSSNLRSHRKRSSSGRSSASPAAGGGGGGGGAAAEGNGSMNSPSSANGGKFTTANFTEAMVTQGENVFGVNGGVEVKTEPGTDLSAAADGSGGATVNGKEKEERNGRPDSRSDDGGSRGLPAAENYNDLGSLVMPKGKNYKRSGGDSSGKKVKRMKKGSRRSYSRASSVKSSDSRRRSEQVEYQEDEDEDDSETEPLSGSYTSKSSLLRGYQNGLTAAHMLGNELNPGTVLSRTLEMELQEQQTPEAEYDHVNLKVSPLLPPMSSSQTTPVSTPASKGPVDPAVTKSPAEKSKLWTGSSVPAAGPVDVGMPKAGKTLLQPPSSSNSSSSSGVFSGSGSDEKEPAGFHELSRDRKDDPVIPTAGRPSSRLSSGSGGGGGSGSAGGATRRDTSPRSRPPSNLGHNIHHQPSIQPGVPGPSTSSANVSPTGGARGPYHPLRDFSLYRDRDPGEWLFPQKIEAFPSSLDELKNMSFSQFLAMRSSADRLDLAGLLNAMQRTARENEALMREIAELREKRDQYMYLNAQLGSQEAVTSLVHSVVAPAPPVLPPPTPVTTAAASASLPPPPSAATSHHQQQHQQLHHQQHQPQTSSASMSMPLLPPASSLGHPGMGGGQGQHLLPPMQSGGRQGGYAPSDHGQPIPPRPKESQHIPGSYGEMPGVGVYPTSVNGSRKGSAGSGGYGPPPPQSSQQQQLPPQGGMGGGQRMVSSHGYHPGMEESMHGGSVLDYRSSGPPTGPKPPPRDYHDPRSGLGNLSAPTRPTPQHQPSLISPVPTYPDYHRPMSNSSLPPSSPAPPPPTSQPQPGKQRGSGPVGGYRVPSSSIPPPHDYSSRMGGRDGPPHPPPPPAHGGGGGGSSGHPSPVSPAPPPHGSRPGSSSSYHLPPHQLGMYSMGSAPGSMHPGHYASHPGAGPPPPSSAHMHAQPGSTPYSQSYHPAARPGPMAYQKDKR